MSRSREPRTSSGCCPCHFGCRRVLAQITAFLQIIYSIGNLAYFGYVLSPQYVSAKHLQSTYKGHKHEAALKAIVNEILLTGALIGSASIIGMVLGVVLYAGVKQRNLTKLLIWLIMTGILSIFYLGILVRDVMEHSFRTDGIAHIVGICLHILFIVIVSIYRKKIVAIATRPKITFELRSIRFDKGKGKGKEDQKKQTHLPKPKPAEGILIKDSSKQQPKPSEHLVRQPYRSRPSTERNFSNPAYKLCKPTEI